MWRWSWMCKSGTTFKMPRMIYDIVKKKHMQEIRHKEAHNEVA